MGIRGLQQYLKQRLSCARCTPNYTIPGQIWGIDISCILFRARGMNLDILTVLAGLIVRLRGHGVIPIVIFDGYTGGGAKSDTVDARRKERQIITDQLAVLRSSAGKEETVAERDIRVTQEAALIKKAPTVNRSDRDLVKQFLHMAGVQFVTARGEADDFLAALFRENRLQAVVTTDTDAFARGVQRVIIPEVADATVLTEWSLPIILRELHLTYEQFVLACVLMGSDYTVGRSYPPIQAIQMVKERKDLLEDKSLGPVADAVNILIGSSIVSDDLLEGKQLEKWQKWPSGTIASLQRETVAMTALADEKGWPASWLAALT